jgi:ABC-type branched-subunit amino acid transport system substrate-binding protein
VGACLSLTGRFARFGIQAARGLKAWRALASAVLVIEDDESSPRRLETVLPQVAERCDVLLGPYSTQLMRVAGRIAADAGWLLWNHGGSGDDVEAAHPGHVVSVLTPTTRYAEPFLRHLAGDRQDIRLWMMHGKGSFGRQVTAGARAAARNLGIEAAPPAPGTLPEAGDVPSRWGLLCAGTFEGDVEAVRRARTLPNPPAVVCAVAAGVREFGEAIGKAEGIFGVGQWFPGVGGTCDLGPTEAAFLVTYSDLHPSVPDYPAVQAAAGAVIAAHCARLAGGTDREALWHAALGLDAKTLFGGFRVNDAGVQVGHDAVLVRWTAHGPVAALLAHRFAPLA